MLFNPGDDDTLSGSTDAGTFTNPARPIRVRAQEGAPPVGVRSAAYGRNQGPDNYRKLGTEPSKTCRIRLLWGAINSSGNLVPSARRSFRLPQAVVGEHKSSTTAVRFRMSLAVDALSSLVPSPRRCQAASSLLAWGLLFETHRALLLRGQDPERDSSLFSKYGRELLNRSAHTPSTVYFWCSRCGDTRTRTPHAEAFECGARLVAP